MKLLIPVALMALSAGAMANVYKLLDTKAKSDVSVEQLRGNVNIQFHISQLETEHASEVPVADFTSLKFKNLRLTSAVGTPSLPFKTIIVKGTPSEIEVDYNLGKEVVINNVIPVPAMPEKLRCVDCVQPTLEVNWESYAKTNSELVKKEYLGDFRGQNLTKVTVYPSVFVAENDSLNVYPEVNFSVRTNTRANLATMVMPSNLIKESDLNKKYMIISPKKFLPTLQKFVDHKEALGYDVDVFEQENAGETAEEIKEFIHAKYAQNEYTYALLIGHETSFPTFYRRTSSSYRTPTDMPYFAMDGESDYIAEVFHGRMVVDNATELANQIAKTIEYETQSYTDKSGLGRSLGMASNEGYNPSDVDYVKAMLVAFEDLGLTPKHFLQSNYDSTPTNVNAELSKGVSWLSYIGHGSGTSWPSQKRTYYASSFKQNDTEGKVKPIIIDVACMNGNYKYGKGNLGVTAMNAVNNGNPTGAVAYYGGSVNISWHPPAIMSVGINRIIEQEGFEHLGPALWAGHLYLSENYSVMSHIKDNYTWFLLQGDPSLELNFL